MNVKRCFLKVTKVIALFVIVSCIYSNANLAFAAPKAEQKELKVLVIEINPFLESKGMKASEFFNSKGSILQDLDLSAQEMKEDFEYSSHNVIKCTIVGKEYLNEFPQYKKEFTLSHYDSSARKRVYTGKGTRLDEKTYMDMFGKGWYGWWNTDNPVIDEGIDAPPFKYDYNYLLEKFDLVNRRNKNEFDMVWVFSIDPLSMGETNMVGRNVFWPSGDMIDADCDNFIMAGFTLSRRDSALECIGHMAEAMLNHVYETQNYNATLEFKSLDELNTWERFYLCKDKAPKNWKEYGVGQVHFSPNSERDYDWDNKTPVQSTWEDWKYNYPNLTGKTTTFTPSVYYDSSMQLNRAHKRWWLSLMPHYQGRDDKGYSHNWWDYIAFTDYVEQISTYNTYKESAIKEYKGSILLEKGEDLPELKFRLQYASGKKEDFVIDDFYNFVTIDNKKVITIENGKVKAIGKGQAKLTLNYDGRKASYKVSVVEDKSEVFFSNIKVTPESHTLYFDGTSDKKMNIKITAPKDMKYSVTYTSGNNGVAKVSKEGVVTAVGKGTTRITTKVKVGNFTKEYITKIISNPASIRVTSTKTSLKVGERFGFEAKSEGLSGRITWSVSNASILSVDVRTGIVTAKKAGTANVIAKDGKLTKNIKVTVK